MNEKDIKSFLNKIDENSQSFLENFLEKCPNIEKKFLENPVKVLREFDYKTDLAILGLSLLTKKTYPNATDDITLIVSPAFLHFLRVKIEKKEGRKNVEEKVSHLLWECIASSMSGETIHFKKNDVQRTFVSTSEIMENFINWYDIKEEKHG